MRQLFAPDSKLMIFLGVVKNLMILGLIFTLTALPVVTFGAAFTALHFAVIRLARDEDGSLVRDYFRSFKLNFRQATILWMLVLLIIGFFAWDIYVIRMNPDVVPGLLQIVLLIAAAVVLLIAIYAFPLLSKFENTVGGTMKNAFFMTLTSLPRAILMLVLYLVPSVLGGYYYEILPLVVIFGFSVPAYISARWIYGKKFMELEQKILEKNGDICPPKRNDPNPDTGSSGEWELI